MVMFSVLFFSDCKKKEKNVTEDVYAGIPGDMKVQSPSANTIDLDGDGVNDIELHVASVKTGPGAAQDKQFSLICLHNRVLLRTDEITETVVRDSSVTVQPDSTNKPHKFVKISSRIDHCTNLTGGLIISKTQKMSLVNFSGGDEIDAHGNFSSGSMPLLNPAFSFIVTDLSSDPDTVFVWANTSDKDCSSPLHSGENFFGFTLKDNLRDRIGWIKITNNNGISITQTAITP
jgi:hypothetical protein